MVSNWISLPTLLRLALDLSFISDVSLDCIFFGCICCVTKKTLRERNKLIFKTTAFESHPLFFLRLEKKRHINAVIFTMANWSPKETAGVPQTFIEYAKNPSFFKSHDIDISVFQHWCFQKNSLALWNWHGLDLIFLIFKLIHSQKYEIFIPTEYWSALHSPLATSPYF